MIIFPTKCFVFALRHPNQFTSAMVQTASLQCIRGQEKPLKAEMVTWHCTHIWGGLGELHALAFDPRIQAAPCYTFGQCYMSRNEFGFFLNMAIGMSWSSSTSALSWATFRSKEHIEKRWGFLTCFLNLYFPLLCCTFVKTTKIKKLRATQEIHRGQGSEPPRTHSMKHIADCTNCDFNLYASRRWCYLRVQSSLLASLCYALLAVC